jgi:DNA-binding IclR family transcriptional regulator
MSRAPVRKPGTQRKQPLLTSASRALRVLKAFDTQRTEFGVTELARETGLSKSSAHVLLTTLHEERFLDRNTATGRYRLGLAAVRLGVIALSRTGFGAWSQERLEELSARTGESTTIGVLDDDSVLFLQRVGSREVLRVELTVGARVALHASALGKVLLAYAPDAERTALLDRLQLPRLAERTITSRRALEADLARVRRRGYAESVEEILPGISAIAAPVRDWTRRVVAGVSVSGPTSRFAPHQAVDEVVAAGEQLSRELGYTGETAGTSGGATRDSPAPAERPRAVRARTLGPVARAARAQAPARE